MYLFTPLEGFKVISLLPLTVFNIDLSITNIALSTFLISLFTIYLSVMLSFKRMIVPSQVQLLAESIYEASITLIGSSIGRRGMIYFPYLFSLYLFLSMANMLGGLPYASLVTAQIIITAGLGFSTFIGLVLLYVYYHKVYILSSLLPSGSPQWISPLLVVIELISYIFRPISLSVRLFANIMAGHTLMVIFMGFGYKLLFPISMYSIVSLLIFTIIFFIIALETGIQLIQAYVFTLLTSNYLNQTLYLDH